MRRFNRSGVRRAAGAGIAVIVALVAAAAFLAPMLVERFGLRQQLVEQISERLGGNVEIAALRVSLLPRPHLMIDQLRLSIAPRFDAAIESAAVFPRLRALLTGKLQLAHVDVSGVHVRLRGVKEGEPTPGPSDGTTMQGLRESVSAALATVVSGATAHAPGLVVQLTDGAVSLALAEGPTVSFTDIHGRIRLPPGELSIDLAVGSNLWDQGTLRATIDPASKRGDGVLTLTGMRPQAITPFFPPADLKIGDATARLDVRLNTDGFDMVRADVEATAAKLPLQRAAAELMLEGVRVKAGLTLDAERLGITLDEVHVDVPPLQLSGSLVRKAATPDVRIELVGKDLDVSNAHAAAVFFVGANPVAQAIFNILQAGTVPHLTLEAQGRTLEEAATLDAMLIRGALVNGTVRLPGNGLDLEDVSGEVSIANGVLVGEHAAGRVGNTRARDGSVRVGLTGAERELSVSTVVAADVRDLPEVLTRVVANDTLTRILERLADLQGRAEGQFTLGGTTDAATAALDVSQLSITTRVRGFDQPLHIDGGPFHYDPSAITASGLTVAAGASMLSQVALRVDTSVAVPSIDVSGAPGHVALAEIYPSVVASGWMPASPWSPTTLAGTLAVDSVRVRGPAVRPADWRVEMAGGARGLDIEAPRLREVSAVRFPVALSDFRLTHTPTANAVSTAVATADGLTGMLDVRWGADELNVKRLSVRDAHSDATLSFLLKEREVDLTFSGSLDTATLKEVVPDEHEGPRSMRGDFQARIVLDEPARSTAKGRLEVVHLAVPGPGDLRLHVTHADLHASGGLLAIDAEGELSAGLVLHLHGALRPVTDALIADLDVSAGEVEWARLAPLLRRAAADSNKSSGAAARPLPLRGKVRISAESFTYGGYTWRPVRAVVDLARGRPSITVTQANLCRIATPGKIAMIPGGLSVQFTPRATAQPLGQMTTCLFGQPARLTGQYNLAGQVQAAGAGADILASARGHVQLGAAQGRIYGGGVIEKVLAVMSVGYGSWNIFADLTDDGLPYNTIATKADLRDGKLVLSEGTMDAPSMKMVAEGSVDMNAGTIDLVLLAAPLKTVDSVVSRIPILGSVLGGSLLTIPIKVSGPLQDPTVTPMSPSEVGSGLLRVMTRIGKLPLRLLDPFLPADEKP